MTVDPVCKMKVEPDKDAAKAEYGGRVYYFCSSTCHRTFVADPSKYAGGTEPADHSFCGGRH
ncbi:MAG: YHS domain-containing protein [Candidimonas sp.]|nr:MAG: YHS domain-containing protein [Candidimonas sp.]TAM21895.1 MAG: YHS domain-containing protein [Candidimonas sp.]